MPIDYTSVLNDLNNNQLELLNKVQYATELIITIVGFAIAIGIIFIFWKVLKQFV